MPLPGYRATGGNTIYVRDCAATNVILTMGRPRYRIHTVDEVL